MAITYEQTCQGITNICTTTQRPCYLELSSETQISEEASRKGGMSKDQADRFRQRCAANCPREQAKNR